MMDKGFNWMAGGPQGSGVDTAANIFGRACGYGGLYVYGRREYHSNIKGLHSYFHLRISSSEVSANVNDVDMLAAFDTETVVRHIAEIVPKGGIIVDQDQLNIKILEIPTLPIEFKTIFQEFLKENGIGDRLADLLEYARNKDIHVFEVPYMELLKQIASKLGIEKLSKITRMINVLTIGVSFGLLGYNIGLVEKAVKDIFGEKPKIVEMNLFALEIAYEYAKDNFSKDFNNRIPKGTVNEERIFLSGNQAVAIGKVLGGCRVQTYYPITPAADESEYIEAHEILSTKVPGVEAGVVVLQTEDEIAAINMASGGSFNWC